MKSQDVVRGETIRLCLPATHTEEVARTIAVTGASGPGGQGKVTPKAMAELRGKADGRHVSAVVTRSLSAEVSAVSADTK